MIRILCNSNKVFLFFMTFIYLHLSRKLKYPNHHQDIPTTQILVFSLTICPYQPLLYISRLDGTQCPYRADECNFLLFRQHWCVQVLKYIGERCLWVCPPAVPRMFYSPYLNGLLIKIYELFYPSSCRDRCLLLTAPGNSTEIQFEQVQLATSARSFAQSASVIVSVGYCLLFASYSVKTFYFIRSIGIHGT